MFFQTPAIDLALLKLINQQWRNPFFDWLMPILSSKTIIYVLIVPLLWWVWKRFGVRHLMTVVVLIAAVGCSDVSTNLVKKSITRVRPLNSVAETYYREDGKWMQRAVEFVQTKEKGSSYPSAHSSNTMCIALLALLFWPALKKWPLILPLLVGYSRVYLGKHYPMDVVAGWLFGAVIAGFVWLIWKYVFEPPLLGRLQKDKKS